MESIEGSEPPTALQTLAAKHFSHLSRAETKLLQAASAGKVAYCGPNDDPDDDINNPRLSDGWGTERQIRSDLIRWLCVHQQAETLVDPKGIWIFGAKIIGSLNLSYLTLRFPLSAAHCRIVELAELTAVEMPELGLSGAWVNSISADYAKIRGSIFLTYPFHAFGKVSLMGAQVGGDLVCNTASIKNPAQPNNQNSGTALTAERAVINGSVFLRNGFYAEGEVNFSGSQIGGDLDCNTGTFKNPLDPNAPTSWLALGIAGADIKGNVFFRKGFYADGDVSLMSAQIGRTLDCSDATIQGELIAERATIKGTLFWTNIKHPESAKINLLNATAGSIQDDEPSWPPAGNLVIDGFVYHRIIGGPRDAETRIKWIARQKTLRLQPYRQLASVLTDEGNDDGARLVLIEMERQRRGVSWSSQPTSWLLRGLIGYGYEPARALWGLLILTGIGWVIYRRAYIAGTMTPTEGASFRSFKITGQTPENETSFSPFFYSLENTLPLVKLGQTDRWHPSPQALIASPSGRKRTSRLAKLIATPKFVQRFLFIQILLGWILATLFAAAIAGLVHKN